MGIIAYPKHDSLLVQIGNEFDAVEVCKNEFKNYVSSFQKENKLPELGFDIAFKVKFDALNHIKIRVALVRNHETKVLTNIYISPFNIRLINKFDINTLDKDKNS